MSKKKRRTPQGYKAKPAEPAAPKAAAPDFVETESVDAGELESYQEYVAPDDDEVRDENMVLDIPKWEHSLIDVTPQPVAERDLKRLIRDWRRGRATTTIGQVLADGYVTIFAVVLIVGMLGGGVYRAQAAAAGCNTDVCTVGRTLLPWVAMSAAFTLTALASRIFGPVVASAAEGFWLMDAPIRRGRLLVGRLVAVIIVVGLIAAGLGGLLAALTGYGLADVGKWALAMGVGAAGLTALAGSEQTWSRTWLITVVQWIFGIVAIGALFVIVSVAAGWFGITLPTVTGAASVIWVGVGGGVLLVAAGGLALARLGLIHRARLVSGGSLVAGMQGAAFAMDFGLMRDILVERDAMNRGHVRPQRGGGMRGSALVWRELQRLWRYPKRILIVVISLVVPYAVTALGFHTFSPFISSLVLLVGFVPMLGSMRVMTRTKGLARTMPLSNPQIRKALATVPAGVAVVWALAATPAFWGIEPGAHFGTITGAFTTAVLTAVAGLLGAIRWVTAKSANYNMPMMQTGFGAMPPNLMFNMIRGIDVVVLVTGPLLLGWAWYISAIIAVILAIALSGFYSMEEMQAMQEEVKKDQAKSGRGGGGGLFAPKPAEPAPTTKQKIAPPKGYRTPPVAR